MNIFDAVRTTKRVAFVSSSPKPDGDELGNLELPSYGVRRVTAAANALSNEIDIDVRHFDLSDYSENKLLEELHNFAPHIIGFSVYVWSLPQLVQMARQIKKRHEDICIIFGGPSARTSVFRLKPFQKPHEYLDAICEGDGEAIIQNIMREPNFRRSTLIRVRGLALPNPDGSWHQTGPATQLSMSDIPSPYQQGLMPKGAVAYLETYRGCPLSCRFCEWGAVRPARDVFPTDYISAEIDAFESLEAPAVFLLDAGLNLNATAFRNLAEANARTKHLKNALFWAEIYPSSVRSKHLEFLENIGTAYLGVGLQSMDQAVLDAHDRKIDQSRFEPSVRELSKVASGLEIQIIFGLPGETPTGFLQTLDFALSLPGSVRVYHCLVLPDALLTRSKPEWNVRFNPKDMTMISNSHWREVDIKNMRSYLNTLAQQHNGTSGAYWWSFK